MNDTPEIIAFLHCELPTNGKATPVSSSAGTLDLGEVEGEGASTRETISLGEGQVFRIGRARANDLVIENQSVSRFHAVLSASATGVVLSDLSSLNGTQLNSRRISAPVDLCSGDVVQIGNVKITVEMSRGASSPRRDQDEDETIVSTHAAKMSSVVVTVLVADVCGYTALSQKLPPHDVAEMLNSWFRRIVAAITANGGEIDKYIGDCVMALWKNPDLTPETSAVNAVRAAAKILEETEALASSGAWKHQSEHPWKCRVALNTGEALMGAVGTSSARDFTVLGDTVNIAFRLESLASSEGSSLAISETTANLVSDMIHLRSLGHAILEGRKDNMEIFTLERE
ncbi:MAG: adenylate/guanylate cyclase domain-containing protein [Bdellovibrionota bacterium]